MSDRASQSSIDDGMIRDTSEIAMDSPLLLDALRVAMMWRLHPRTAHRLHTRIATGGSLDLLLENLESLQISPRTRAVLGQIPSREEAIALAGRLLDTGIQFVITGQPGFPEELASIPDPPPYLFLRGSCWGQPRLRPTIGIIGSRAASRSGREIARTLARDLALSGCTVVSGLARGIDSEAHRGVLAADGCTIGVLGAGLDVVYPPEHEELQSEMLREGGVISEFPPGAPPLRLHFPRRNRILAGLIDVLIVVEGAEKSGARSTVDHALDQGREVMAVPRDPVIPGSVLPNRLLFEGARPAISARDVIEAAGASKAALSAPRSLHGSSRFGRAAQPGPAANANERNDRVERSGTRGRGSTVESAGTDGSLAQRALALLQDGPRELDALIAELTAPASALQASLAELEVLGWVEREQGRYRRR